MVVMDGFKRKRICSIPTFTRSLKSSTCEWWIKTALTLCLVSTEGNLKAKSYSSLCERGQESIHGFGLLEWWIKTALRVHITAASISEENTSSHTIILLIGISTWWLSSGLLGLSSFYCLNDSRLVVWSVASRQVFTFYDCYDATSRSISLPAEVWLKCWFNDQLRRVIHITTYTLCK